MQQETPEEKWKRLQGEIHEGILDGYPNPERRGCLDHDCIHALAHRAAQFDETIEDDPNWKHTTHCSPCYAEYLEAFKSARARKPVASAE